MEVINISDFYNPNFRHHHIMDAVSRHCNSPYTEEEIVIICGDNPAFECYWEDMTYPKVIYVDKLRVRGSASLKIIFPDLVKVGDFTCDMHKIVEFGKIRRIGFFYDMSQILRKKRPIPPLICEKIGNKLYNFTSTKGSWDIMVDNYD